jgi:hypothetical protein
VKAWLAGIVVMRYGENAWQVIQEWLGSAPCLFALNLTGSGIFDRSYGFAGIAFHRSPP